MEEKINQSSTRSGTFDSLYNDWLLPFFSSIPDHRRANNSYDLLDCLKSGFAIFSLKMPSLFSFQKRSQAENSNLATVYGIQQIPSDNGLRKILDGVSPRLLRQGFHLLFKQVKRLGILDKFRYFDNHFVVSIDGVEHFCSKKVSCVHCLERKHRDDLVTYHHSMLSAAIVHPEEKEVFILDNEPIVKQDGSDKNDCEQNAALRLLSNLSSHYQSESMIVVMDALFARKPVIDQILACPDWLYVIGVKPVGHKALFRHFQSRDERGHVKWHTIEDEQGQHRFGYANSLVLNGSTNNFRVNMLLYELSDPKGRVKKFSWVTNINLDEQTLSKVMRIGRSRWKIENETFNTLKNQGYHFEHNFGHGNQYLCTNFAYLMMMAFCVDQIQQHYCQYFKTILRGLKTRVKLWESLRAVFKILPCKNMTQIFFCIADMYQIRLE